MPEFDATTEYRDVVGFPGYKVGSDGSVWSCRAGSRWKQLSPAPTASGHLIVNLRPGNNPVYVHRLVLEAFIGPCPPGMECCHDPDRNPSNNALSNLRWGTRKANRDDSRRHGTLARGEKIGISVLTEDVVRAIRKDHASGEFTQRKIAERHGTSQMNVSNVVRRITWKHVV